MLGPQPPSAARQKRQSRSASSSGGPSGWAKAAWWKTAITSCVTTQASCSGSEGSQQALGVGELEVVLDQAGELVGGGCHLGGVDLEQAPVLRRDELGEPRVGPPGPIAEVTLKRILATGSPDCPSCSR